MTLKQTQTWKSDEWDFEYEIPEFDTGGTGEYSPVVPRDDPFSGLLNFGSALFEGLFKFFGDVFTGAVDFVGNVFGPVFEAVGNAVVAIIGGLANVFESVVNFLSPKNSGPIQPVPEVLNPFQTAILETLTPMFDQINKNTADMEALNGDAESLAGDIDTLIKDMDPDSPYTKAWVIDQEIKRIDREWKEKAEENFRKLNEATRELAQTQLLMFSAKANTNISNHDHWKYTNVNGTWVLEAVGDWAGSADITFHGTKILRSNDSGDLSWSSSGIGSGVGIQLSQHHSVSIPDNGNRKWNAPYPRETVGSTVILEGSSVSVVYQLLPGTPQEKSFGPVRWDPTQTGAWVTIPGFEWEVPDDVTNFSYNFSVGWDAADRGTQYGVRVRNISRNLDLSFDGPRNDIGPLTSLGNGNVTMNTQGLGIPSKVEPGNKIAFQIWTTGNTDARRRVRDGKADVYWIKPAKEENA